MRAVTQLSLVVAHLGSECSRHVRRCREGKWETAGNVCGTAASRQFLRDPEILFQSWLTPDANIRKLSNKETPRRYEAVPRALVAKILDAQGSTFTSSIGEGVFFNKTLKIGESPIYHSSPLTLPQSEVDSPPMRADNLIAFPCIINTTTK